MDTTQLWPLVARKGWTGSSVADDGLRWGLPFSLRRTPFFLAEPSPSKRGVRHAPWSSLLHGILCAPEFGISHPLGVALEVPERLLGRFWQPVIGAIPAPGAGSAVTRPRGQVPPQLSSCGWTQSPSVGPSSEAERPPSSIPRKDCTPIATRSTGVRIRIKTPRTTAPGRPPW